MGLFDTYDDKKPLRTGDLVRLPDGSWVDPKRISGIRVLKSEPKSMFHERGIGDRVAVDTIDGNCILIWCDSPEHAIAVADAIGHAANGRPVPVPSDD